MFKCIGKVVATQICNHVQEDQARIHTGFHCFTEMGQVFHNKHICNGNRTEWSPIRSVIIRVINKIGRPRSGRPICLITSMISNNNSRTFQVEIWKMVCTNFFRAVDRNRGKGTSGS